MRIVLVTPHWPPCLSGLGDYAWHLSHALALAGVDVDVVVLGDDVAAADFSGGPVRSVPLPTRTRQLREAAETILRDSPDAVCLQFEAHAFQLRATPHLLPALLRLRRVPVVLTYHELWPPRRLGRLMKLALLQTPNRVIVTSEWHREGVRRFRRAGRIPNIVPVGTNVPGIPGDRMLLRSRFGFEDGIAIITFFGFVIPAHNVHEVVEAVAILVEQNRDVRLSVIGAFDPIRNSYHQRLVAAVDRLRLDSHVTFHGRVEEPAAVARLIAITSVGVLPYDQGVGENNGSFAAFAALGVPVVTTRGPRSPRMEDEDVAVFSEPRPAELATSIVGLLDDGESAASIGARAETWASSRTWRRTAEAYVDALAELVRR